MKDFTVQELTGVFATEFRFPVTLARIWNRNRILEPRKLISAYNITSGSFLNIQLTLDDDTEIMNLSRNTDVTLGDTTFMELGHVEVTEV